MYNCSMKFCEDIKVKYSEMDYRLSLKPSALLNFLQDMASQNAENLGFGYSYIEKRRLCWFLLKYHMEFLDYPVSVYDLTIKTEPRGYLKQFAFRDFELCQGQKCLAKIISTWSLVDMNSKSIVPIEKALEGNPNMPKFEKREGDLSFQKIMPLEKADIEKVFEIRYDDIDVNCHANNCNYIIWAFEPLSFDFKTSRHLKILDMVFKKEIKYGSKVLSKIQFVNQNQTVHLLQNVDSGEDLCTINAIWS